MSVPTARHGPPAIEIRATLPGPARSTPLRGLLEAKLLVPRRRPGLVRRTTILRRLHAARDHRVVSLVGPPGYGKTSVLAQWAAAERRPVAWLTADDQDNDPEVFLAYLAAAIDRISPLDPAVFRTIRAPAASHRTVVGRLLAALQERGGPALIVVDDAHRISEPACLDVLAEFVRYLPPASQVAVAARGSIGLPLARWRADGTVLDIGPGDLALDEREAMAMTRQSGLDLPAAAVSELIRRTEGWPALLALAVLEARRSGRRDAHSLLRGGRLVADYLRSELLEPRAQDEVEFLTRTSILEHLTGPLCDAVTDGQGSAEQLARLARSTVLIDEYGGSYRYHTLLREFLRDELEAREPTLVAGLHRRASAWYQAHDLLDASVEHAFAAHDIDRAAAIVGGAMLGTRWSGRRATTRRWLRRFADDELRVRPWLAVLAAWEELGAGEVTALEHLASIVDHGTFEGEPPDGSASFESGRAMLRAAMCRAGADDMQANAALAVSLEPADSPWRDFALWILALAALTKGDPERADAVLADAVAAARAHHHTGLLYCLLGHRALLAVDRGDWAAASAFGTEGDELGVSAQLDGYLSTAPACAARARLALHRGDFAGARSELARAMTLRPVLTAAAPQIAVLSILGLARAYVAIGDPAGARTLLAQAGQVIRARPDLGILPGEIAALRAAVASLPYGVGGGSSTITAAELRVLALLPYYLSFKEIGQRLGIKATTVKTHALAIYGKLGASTRSEAVELAVEAGLLGPLPL